MKPIPAQKAAGGVAGEVIPSLPSSLATPTGSYSSANRRSTPCASQRIYPWLLSASTAVAALFCLLYITKPVITPVSFVSPSPVAPKSTPSNPPATSSTAASLMPSGKSLPGEKQDTVTATKPAAVDPRQALPNLPASSAFEETNLRIQHVLTAEAPGGHQDRIVLDVPVLYQSRNLRWTPEEVAESRQLLVRLMDYQEKSQHLRAEGVELLDSWNRLMSRSIPASDLRADSPSLPANQEDGADEPRPAGLITTESIQLKTSGK